MERAIRKAVTVAAPLGEVWRAWTTVEGTTSFFAPQARVELRPGGPYELLFDLEAPEGSRGSEGAHVLCYLPEEMLAFEWNAPPQFEQVRGEHTWVVVQFEPGQGRSTHVRLTHLGWRVGAEWEQVYAYFLRAWDIVLARLERRFAVGPIDWANPYQPAPVNAGRL